MAELFVTLLTDQDPPLERLAVDLTVESHDPGGTRWHGWFKVPARSPVTLGQLCRLAFSDGRQGEMEITRLTYGRPAEEIRVFFRGRSRLAQPA